MLTAKETRKRAWKKLKGKWGTYAVCSLIYFLFIACCSVLTFIFIGPIILIISGSLILRYSYIALNVFIGPIIALIISGSLILGYSFIALNVSRRKTINKRQIFYGFKHFGSSFALYVCNNILLFLWALLFIIPGIIKSISYSMSFFALADNPYLSSSDARNKSIEIMNGKKLDYFILNLSFIGWILLGALTFGILYFWIFPYIFTAQAEFYRDIINESDNKQMYDDGKPIDKIETDFSDNEEDNPNDKKDSDSLNPYF